MNAPFGSSSAAWATPAHAPQPWSRVCSSAGQRRRAGVARRCASVAGGRTADMTARRRQVARTAVVARLHAGPGRIGAVALAKAAPDRRRSSADGRAGVAATRHRHERWRGHRGWQWRVSGRDARGHRQPARRCRRRYRCAPATATASRTVRGLPALACALWRARACRIARMSVVPGQRRRRQCANIRAIASRLLIRDCSDIPLAISGAPRSPCTAGCAGG